MESEVTIQNFPPDGMIGQNVAIHYLGTIVFKRISFVEPIPWFQCLNIGAIALQTQSARTPAPLLEMHDGEWGQFRWYPLDYAQVRLFLPASQGKWTLRNIQVGLDPQITFRNPDLSMTEFHIWEDNAPNFEALNIADYALNACRIMAGGYRYIGIDIERKLPDVLAGIKAGTIICKHIWASGAASVPD
jgi:hypothetical protein